MSIEAILRIVLLAASLIALAVGIAAYRSATGSRARIVLIVLVAAWAAGTSGSGIYLTPKIGPIVRTEGLLLALAPVGALFGGLAAGKRKSIGLRPVPVIIGLTLLVLTDLGAFYHLNRSLAQIAGELGLSTMRKKYEPIADKDCTENLKSLYFAFSQYVDGNGSLPPADRWMENEEIASKVQKAEWFHCPEVSNRHDERYGYAYNDAIAGRVMNGKKLSDYPDAAHTPLLYDSSNLAKSAHDSFISLPRPGRHGGRNNVLYCDGHVEAR